MNKRKLILLMSVVTVAVMTVVFALSTLGIAKVNNAKALKLRLKKPDVTDLVFVAVNNWNYVMRNNGSYMYDSPDQDENGNNAGGEFPRGSGITIVYAGGLYIGTIKNGEEVVSETEFATEFQPGAVTNSGVPFEELVADNPLSATNKVYFVDRTMSGDDFNNWPDLAPVTSLDVPAVIADGQTWAVFNDLDISLNAESEAESPFPGLGMQVIAESFAFNAGPLSDVVYVKLTITNKTNTRYPNSYLGAWMDADVNNSSNDIVGVDTAAGLGYVYNNTNEGPGQDFATGFDFFQGPVVDVDSISADLATKFAANKTVLSYDADDNIYVAETLPVNKIWLGATAFNTYANGTDPIDNRERYNLLAGRNKTTGVKKSGCGLDDYYAFRGNPITQQGTCDVAGSANPMGGLFATAADQRILHGVGPFTIEAGASQEIWLGIVGAGGTDRLNAVANMFATDGIAQTTFEAGLVAPAPPIVPEITVYALDSRVNISWKNNAEISNDIAGEILGINTGNGFSDDYLDYDFQGYRVWKSRTGLPGSFTMLAQYDKVDGITRVQNYVLNPQGDVTITYVDVGTDSGLRYNYVDTDVINGQKYFYSVTAYDAQPYIGGPDVYPSPVDGVDIPKPSGLPISLETAPTSNVVSVVPWHAPASDLQNNAAASAVTHATGVSDGSIELEVVDPAAVINGSYTVNFYNLPDSVGGKEVIYGAETSADQFVFEVERAGNPVAFSSKVDDPRTFIDGGNGILDLDSLGNPINGDLIFDDRLFSTAIAIPDADLSDEQFDVCEGLLVKAYGPPLNGVSAAYTNGPQYTTAGVGAGQRWFSGVNFGLELVGGGVGLSYHFLGSPIDPASLKTVEIRFSRTVWQTSYGHAGAFGNQNEFFPVPFTVWDVDQEDALPDRMLNTMSRDGSLFNGNGWFLDNTLGGDGSGPQQRTYLHIILSNYDSTAGSLTGLNAGNTNAIWSLALSPRAVTGAPADGFTWNTLLKTARGAGSPSGTTVDATERDAIYAQIPDEGKLKLTAPNVIVTSDTYTFTTTARTAATKAQTKSMMKDIRVVPNPYYGRSDYQASLFDKRVKFTNLPAECTIKIFTVSGDLVRTLTHNGASSNNVQNGNDRRNTNPLNLFAEPTAGFTAMETWNLQNDDGKFVASGMYIALVEAKGIGKKLVKFAIIQEELTINGPDVR